jgi:hypothetical protein
MYATITIENRLLENMSKEYKDSLQLFIANLNNEFQNEKSPIEEGKQIQAKVNELADATTKLKDAIVDEDKKQGIRNRLKDIAITLARASPNVAKTIVNLTPLAPFSQLIGETFENMIQTALKK